MTDGSGLMDKRILCVDDEAVLRALLIRRCTEWGYDIECASGSDEAIEMFADSKLIKRKLGFLHEVGLGYITLGQKFSTLSGGEAQRVRLAKILSKKLGDRCVYILDTPTKGLHLSDLPVLIGVLQKIIDKNNTVLIADNKVEMISKSDYCWEIGGKRKKG